MELSNIKTLKDLVQLLSIMFEKIQKDLDQKIGEENLEPFQTKLTKLLEENSSILEEIDITRKKADKFLLDAERFWWFTHPFFIGSIVAIIAYIVTYSTDPDKVKILDYKYLPIPLFVFALSAIATSIVSQFSIIQASKMQTYKEITDMSTATQIKEERTFAEKLLTSQLKSEEYKLEKQLQASEAKLEKQLQASEAKLEKQLQASEAKLEKQLQANKAEYIALITQEQNTREKEIQRLEAKMDSRFDQLTALILTLKKD
jgi:hypothetical protein